MLSDRIFVLKTVKYGESDLIVQGLSTQGDKVSFFAKCGRKSVKRFGGGILEPTHFIEVQYSDRKDSQNMFTLNDAKLIKSFQGVRSEYEKLETALFVLSLIERVSFEGMVDGQNVYNLLGNTLAALEDSKNHKLLRLHFQIRFLKYQGFLPGAAWTKSFLEISVKDHEKIALSVEQEREAESEVAHCMSQLFA